MGEEWSVFVYWGQDFFRMKFWTCRASLVAQMVDNLPAMWENWVRSLGWEDIWRREWLPSLVFLPGEFHGQRRLMGYGPWGSQRVGHE